ncbi:MAG: hypothetical protein DRI90_16260 [Deltaproteobacteria bacterium]|nr:MAG: hypothetical protein DRI90_16260 [Deltaproteobacteria bacterium]
MSRPAHPNKHVEEAIGYAEDSGWSCKVSKKGHCWGTLWCPLQDRDGCRMSVSSTPRSPENHGKQIRRRVDRCSH